MSQEQLDELTRKVDFILKSIKMPVKSKTVGPDGHPRIVQVSLQDLYIDSLPRRIKL